MRRLDAVDVRLRVLVDPALMAAVLGWRAPVTSHGVPKRF